MYFSSARALELKREVGIWLFANGTFVRGSTNCLPFPPEIHREPAIVLSRPETQRGRDEGNRLRRIGTLSCRLEATEEEHLVANDFVPKRTAELVALQRIVTGRKRVARIYRAVA